MHRPAIAACVALAATVAGAVAGAAPVPKAKRCPLFPKSFSTNQRVDRLPVAASSDRIMASIGLGRGVKADFGSGLWEGGPIGIPFDVVSKQTKRSRVTFEYADESDRVGYPIPRNVHIEGGPNAGGEAGGEGEARDQGDRHALLLDKDSCKLFELYALRRSGGRWTAGSGAVWKLRSPNLRPAGSTSADAAGLPILPLLARYDEVKRGRIDHALRVTVSRSRRAYVHPARHFASSDPDPALPRMGERLRLRAGYDISGFPPQARVLLQAMKDYGLMVADNGSDMFVSGAPNAGWDNDQLATLRRVEAREFEVVEP